MLSSAFSVLWLSVAHKTVDPRGSGGSFSNAIIVAAISVINDAHIAPEDMDKFIERKCGDDMSTPAPPTCEGIIRAISCFSVEVSPSIIKSCHKVFLDLDNDMFVMLFPTVLRL